MIRLKTNWSIFILIAFLVGACQPKEVPPTSQTGTTEEPNSIKGAWDLIYGEYTDVNGETLVRQSDNSFQIKIFSDQHFALIMRNDEGGYQFAVSGTYYLDGNKYIETFDWIMADNPKLQDFAGGGKYILEWKLEGDTLYMQGPVESYDNTGKAVQAANNLNHFLEKRVRSKSRDSSK